MSKRAVLYLRVSSRGQVETEYDPEGLSLPAQRNTGTEKATRLGADVVREYIEPGVSAKSLLKRKAFGQMIADVREMGDIDYVIVWSVSRWARNQEDHWTARGLIRRAGAQLISVKEPIGGDGSHDIIVEGVMAAVAEGRRIEIAEEVLQGLRRKAEVGGTPFRAPIGYVHVREMVDSHEVRVVVVDPDRAHLVRLAFNLYATGDFALSELAALLEARGLRTRPTRRSEAQPLGVNRLAAMLRNEYYIGVVRYDGKVYEGRHEKLVDEATFQRVQEMLDSKRQSGERAWRNFHYLRGSVFCAECGGRLMYTRVRGRSGYYSYFVCRGRQQHTCSQPNHRVEAVEEAIEHYYRRVQLSPAERERIHGAIWEHFEQRMAVSSDERSKNDEDLARLARQERKLLHAHYEDQISDELFGQEQQRIRRERVAVEMLNAKLQIDHEAGLRLVRQALALTEDIQNAYALAGPQARRIFNQAFFERLLIDREQVDGDVLAEPYATLLDPDLERKLAMNGSDAAVAVGWDLGSSGLEIALAEQQESRRDFEPAGGAGNARTPTLLSLRGGSHVETMVELGGLEPPTSWVRSRRSEG
ncbi:MAG: site-specific recombinase [Solirubrobacteraceae bacterium]